jgi:hypothetical protein
MLVGFRVKFSGVTAQCCVVIWLAPVIVVCLSRDSLGKVSGWGKPEPHGVLQGPNFSLWNIAKKMVLGFRVHNAGIG